jgi:hypothetical protein
VPSAISVSMLRLRLTTDAQLRAVCSRVMPQIGQFPGAGRGIYGCMGQVHIRPSAISTISRVTVVRGGRVRPGARRSLSFSFSMSPSQLLRWQALPIREGNREGVALFSFGR